MKRYPYYICDVFTETAFGGNQLAVFPEASGLSSDQMQKIAREFNFSETTFVLPPTDGGTRRVRIFTPTSEIPFAGHPNIGTACVLRSIGELDGLDKVTFEEKAGLVPITLGTNERGSLKAELTAPEPLSVGDEVAANFVAKALGLDPADIETVNHTPVIASVGNPFVYVELKGRPQLENTKIDLEPFSRIAPRSASAGVLAYTRSRDDFDIRARMFAPLHGIPEDPATGSAACTLAGLLAHLDPAETGGFAFRIAQGFEMGRPSILEAKARKENGTVVSTSVGGASVLVADGYFYADES